MSPECACTGAGALSDTCDQITGQCQCQPGFSGRVCDQCDAGYYGYPNCTSKFLLEVLPSFTLFGRLGIDILKFLLILGFRREKEIMKI